MPGKGEIQAVLFSKDKWTEETSKQWLKDNQYNHLKLDRKGKRFRYSLRNKEDFHHLRTKRTEDGISFIFGYPEKVKKGCELGMRDLAAYFLPKFDWEKYPGEKHLPGYSYCGPGTRLDLRLDVNDKPKPGEEPINGLDRIAYFHDLRYNYAGDNLDLQHNADLIMLEDLKKLKPQSLMERFYRWLCEKIISAKVKLGMGLEHLGEWKPKRERSMKEWELTSVS